jgi:HSP20 family protein
MPDMQSQLSKNQHLTPRKTSSMSETRGRTFQDSISRLLNEFFSPDLLREQAMFVPPVEIEELDNEFMLCVDVPGVPRENINIEVRDDSLIVSGEREWERNEKREGRHFTEVTYGTFYRSFPLPSNVVTEQIRADYLDGVLKVNIPKSERSQAKSIPIGDAGGAQAQNTKGGKDRTH